MSVTLHRYELVCVMALACPYWSTGWTATYDMDEQHHNKDSEKAKDRGIAYGEKSYFHS